MLWITGRLINSYPAKDSTLKIGFLSVIVRIKIKNFRGIIGGRVSNYTPLFNTSANNVFYLSYTSPFTSTFYFR